MYGLYRQGGQEVLSAAHQGVERGRIEPSSLPDGTGGHGRRDSPRRIGQNSNGLEQNEWMPSGSPAGHD